MSFSMISTYVSVSNYIFGSNWTWYYLTYNYIKKQCIVHILTLLEVVYKFFILIYKQVNILLITHSQQKLLVFVMDFFNSVNFVSLWYVTKNTYPEVSHHVPH